MQTRGLGCFRARKHLARGRLASEVAAHVAIGMPLEVSSQGKMHPALSQGPRDQYLNQSDISVFQRYYLGKAVWWGGGVKIIKTLISINELLLHTRDDLCALTPSLP